MTYTRICHLTGTEAVSVEGAQSRGRSKMPGKGGIIEARWRVTEADLIVVNSILILNKRRGEVSSNR